MTTTATRRRAICRWGCLLGAWTRSGPPCHRTTSSTMSRNPEAARASLSTKSSPSTTGATAWTARPRLATSARTRAVTAGTTPTFQAPGLPSCGRTSRSMLVPMATATAFRPIRRAPQATAAATQGRAMTPRSTERRWAGKTRKLVSTSTDMTMPVAAAVTHRRVRRVKTRECLIADQVRGRIAMARQSPRRSPPGRPTRERVPTMTMRAKIATFCSRLVTRSELATATAAEVMTALGRTGRRRPAGWRARPARRRTRHQ